MLPSDSVSLQGFTADHISQSVASNLLIHFSLFLPPLCSIGLPCSHSASSPRSVFPPQG